VVEAYKKFAGAIGPSWKATMLSPRSITPAGPLRRLTARWFCMSIPQASVCLPHAPRSGA
jgi:hypothetical protein